MASPNPNWPALSVKVAFNADPNSSITPSWTDLSDRVLDFTVSRGRQYELDQVQAGEATITFADRDEALNPANTGSIYYPNVVPYRELAMQATWPPSAAQAGGPNLVNSAAIQPGTGQFFDPTFESYATGSAAPWVTQAFGGITPLITSAQAFQGTQSLGWNVTVGSGRQIQWAVPTVPGVQYTASIYVYQTAVNTFAFFASGGGSTTTSTTGAWVRLTSTWTATGVNSTLVAGHSTVTNPGSVYVDALQVEAGASASAFSTLGQVIYPIFVGYIERWPTTWNHQGTYGICQVTAVDPLGVLALATLDSELSNAIQAQNPAYYWPLWEGQGAVSFANTTLAGQPPLSVYTSPAGPGNGLTAGNSTLPIPGDNGGVRVTLTPGNGTSASLMDCQMLNAGPVGTSGTAGIQPVPANPAAAWSASVQAWAGVSPYADTRKGLSQTLITLACPPQGSNQAQPLTVGVTGVNYLVGQGLDTSFETETVGSTPAFWGGVYFGSLTITNAKAFDGSQSMTFGPQSNTNGQGVYVQVSVTSGQQYTFTTYVNQTAANTVQVAMKNGSAGPPFDVTGSSTTAVNTWTRLSVTFTASSSTVFLWVWCPGPVNSNATLYIDAVQMEGGPTGSAYTGLFNNAFVSYEGPNGVTLTAIESGTNDADVKMRQWVGSVTQDPAGNTTVSLQIDQSQSASATATTASLGGQLPAGASIVQVGGQATAGLVGQTWNGDVSHVAVWTTALTSAQMAAIYYAGQTGYGAYTFGTERSGARISRWLGYVYGHGQQAIDTGASTMDTSPVQRATYALDAMNGVLLGEGGQLYAGKDGFVVFRARTVRFQNTVPRWVLGELEVPYEADAGWSLDPTQVYNDVQVSRVGGQTLPVYATSYLGYQPGTNSSDGTYGGIQAHVTDGPSMLQYGNRQIQAQVNTASDPETTDHANFLLQRYKQPQQRLETLTISAAGKPAFWAAVLGAELNDRVTIKRRTPVFTMSDDYFVEKLDLSVNFASGDWDLSVQASPVDAQQVWLLGDTSFGVLGSTTRLGW